MLPHLTSHIVPHLTSHIVPHILSHILHQPPSHMRLPSHNPDPMIFNSPSFILSPWIIPMLLPHPTPTPQCMSLTTRMSLRSTSFPIPWMMTIQGPCLAWMRPGMSTTLVGHTR